MTQVHLREETGLCLGAGRRVSLTSPRPQPQPQPEQGAQPRNADSFSFCRNYHPYLKYSKEEQAPQRLPSVEADSAPTSFPLREITNQYSSTISLQDLNGGESSEAFMNLGYRSFLILPQSMAWF